jgi:hypothetical protein
LSELKWKLPDTEGDFGLEEISLDGDFPCLTRESYLKIKSAIEAYRLREKKEEAEKDYV